MNSPNLYRRSAQLALQAMLVLASTPGETRRPVRELAAKLGVPATYLSKIVQELSRAGLLQTMRGPKGGIQLVRPPEEISPWEVLSAVEPVGGFTQCLLAARPCSESAPCPLHAAWAPVRRQIQETLQSRNLREFAAEAFQGGVPFWQPPRQSVAQAQPETQGTLARGVTS